jgi:hypothetical protein
VASACSWVVTNGIRANPVISCGIGHMGPNEDVRDLSGGDCDAPNFDKYVCAESYIGHILDRIGLY